MKEKYKTYQDFLIKELSNYRGDFNKVILYVPNFFSLLCNLLNDEKTTVKMRNLINAALSYFVVPYDIIPEEVYDPYGYIDDLFLCTYILNKIKKEKGIKFLEKHWEYEEDLEEILNRCYQESRDVINEKKLKGDILKYVGLSE